MFPLGLQQLSDCNTLRCIYGTNTNSYMALYNKICILQQSQTNRPLNFVYALLQLPEKEYFLLVPIFYTVQTKYPLCTDMNPLAEIQI